MPSVNGSSKALTPTCRDLAEHAATQLIAGRDAATFWHTHFHALVDDVADARAWLERQSLDDSAGQRALKTLGALDAALLRLSLDMEHHASELGAAYVSASALVERLPRGV